MKMDYEAMLEELANARPDLKEDIMALQEQLVGEDEGSDVNSIPEELADEEDVMPGPRNVKKRIPAELMDEEEEEDEDMPMPPRPVKRPMRK